MFKKIILIGVIGFFGYAAYDYYRAGLHKRPAMPDGAFSISFATGFRAIVEGVPNERPERRYRGYPANDVPSYLADAWSSCRPMDEAQAAGFFGDYELGPGEKYVGLCTIEIDGESVLRGAITSIPNL